MADVVRVVALGNGLPCMHTGRYVVAWNPHTEAGILELTSTADPAKAYRFDRGEAFRQWTTVSRVQRIRPWDGLPNKPLSALTIEILDEAIIGTDRDFPLIPDTARIEEDL